MSWRDNIIGILLLILCIVSAVIMVRAIITGESPTVPDGLRIPFTVVGAGALALLLWRQFGSRFRG